VKDGKTNSLGANVAGIDPNRAAKGLTAVINNPSSFELIAALSIVKGQLYGMQLIDPPKLRAPFK